MDRDYGLGCSYPNDAARTGDTDVDGGVAVACGD